MTKKYHVLSDINQGKYKRGDTIDLTDEQAAPLLKCGAIGEALPEPEPAPPAAPAAPDPEPAPVVAPEAPVVVPEAPEAPEAKAKSKKGAAQ